MDRLPLANGGREVEVFLTGSPFLTGHADEDPGQLLGFTQGLGIRSSAVVPLDVAGERRGVLIASSARPDLFTEDDLRLLAAVSRWVGIVAHRAELLERAAAEAREQGAAAAGGGRADRGARPRPPQPDRPLQDPGRPDRRRARREGRERDLRDADEAASALDHFGRLITDLLDASRLDQGLFQVDVRPVDLAPWSARRRRRLPPRQTGSRCGRRTSSLPPSIPTAFGKRSRTCWPTPSSTRRPARS
jgi:signal transduction histidine kinase